MAIRSNPVACFSVIGFVNMRYDRSNVNAFLAVVTMAVVAAPKIAIKHKTDSWPTKVAMASNINTT